jgi:hypothetical protein
VIPDFYIEDAMMNGNLESSDLNNGPSLGERFVYYAA